MVTSYGRFPLHAPCFCVEAARYCARSPSPSTIRRIFRNVAWNFNALWSSLKAVRSKNSLGVPSIQLLKISSKSHYPLLEWLRFRTPLSDCKLSQPSKVWVQLNDFVLRNSGRDIVIRGGKLNDLHITELYDLDRSTNKTEIHRDLVLCRFLHYFTGRPHLVDCVTPLLKLHWVSISCGSMMVCSCSSRISARTFPGTLKSEYPR